jgi:hypothetical protein
MVLRLWSLGADGVQQIGLACTFTCARCGGWGLCQRMCVRRRAP